nr:hypothetical protein Iba_chr15dCG3220 [Ipomoea batatas]
MIISNKKASREIMGKVDGFVHFGNDFWDANDFPRAPLRYLVSESHRVEVVVIRRRPWLVVRLDVEGIHGKKTLLHQSWQRTTMISSEESRFLGTFPETPERHPQHPASNKVVLPQIIVVIGFAELQRSKETYHILMLVIAVIPLVP